MKKDNLMMVRRRRTLRNSKLLLSKGMLTHSMLLPKCMKEGEEYHKMTMRLYCGLLKQPDRTMQLPNIVLAGCILKAEE